MTEPVCYLEPTRSWRDDGVLRRNLALVIVAVLIVVFARASHVDPQKLWAGVPLLASWVPSMFPPDLRSIGEILYAAFETLSMASIGTLIALAFAFPLGFLAARNTTPHPLVSVAARALLNVTRGTETLVFALVFVAAIGFGPFTGVLAIAFHMMGAIGKAFAEAIEPADKGPMDAVALTGASRLKVIRYALIPDVAPNLIAATLYMWEYTVRSSTVLGIVGAGGIGQTLKDTIDLLDFPKMITVLTVILLMVWMIDSLSAYLRGAVLEPPRADPRRIPRRAISGDSHA
ncbi:phosphonate ABC transporter, permease protein PhnE [Rhodopseudomonas sp. B29]|uniref:phosphonate ABC transporter, permease protein PhnE n=1 Tax=Rhodopseudomonas sp. B29 TaxID=95607 RepID=UPI0003B3F7F3|nr:phosphonate ABC transporter, permease protein PhnE [Rhodopseudomonas sp. B29]